MKRPTVLILIKGLGFGGAERLISDGAARWDRDAFDYRVAYVLPWKDQVVGDLEALEVPVRCIGSDRGMRLGTIGALRQLLKEWNVDLIHVHSPSVAAIARMVKGDRSLVYTEHNIVGSYRTPTRIANRLTYGRNKAVIAVSEAVGDSIASYPGPRATAIPNGVSATFNPPQAAAARAELGVSAGSDLIVHVGNIRPHKGHSNLTDAIALLSESHPDVLVASIGAEKSDGDLARVQAGAQAAGVGDQIRFLGRRANARAFIEAATVFVNPSDVEGLPVAILEAMALERPVVATAVGGVPSVISESTGVLVPPRDPGALADGIAELLEDPARAAMLAKAGRELVETRFGLDDMVGKIEAVYSKALASG